MKNITLFALLLSLFAFGSAGAKDYKVHVKYDKFSTFSALKTYQWSANSEVYGDHDGSIRTIVEDALSRSGFVKTADPKSDFLVAYRVYKEKKTEKVIMDHGRGEVDVFENEYMQGTLLIDIMTPDGQRVLWRGWANAEMKPKWSDEKKIDRIRRAVASLIKKFPPKN